MPTKEKSSKENVSIVVKKDIGRGIVQIGHINSNRIQRLIKDGLLEPMDFDEFPVCESCLECKMTEWPFNAEGRRAQDLLELIHLDVCGPMSIQARGGYEYFITFTDDYFRFGYMYLMK